MHRADEPFVTLRAHKRLALLPIIYEPRSAARTTRLTVE